MDYYGDYLYASIDQYCRGYEPLMVLLDHDYKEDGLNLKIIIDRSKNKALYHCRIKLVGRYLGINIILPYLYKRLSQLHYLRKRRYLIEYKEYTFIYDPENDQTMNIGEINV